MYSSVFYVQCDTKLRRAQHCKYSMKGLMLQSTLSSISDFTFLFLFLFLCYNVVSVKLTRFCRRLPFSLLLFLCSSWTCCCCPWRLPCGVGTFHSSHPPGWASTTSFSPSLRSGRGRSGCEGTGCVWWSSAERLGRRKMRQTGFCFFPKHFRCTLSYKCKSISSPSPWYLSYEGRGELFKVIFVYYPASRWMKQSAWRSVLSMCGFPYKQSQTSLEKQSHSTWLCFLSKPAQNQREETD